VFSEGSCILRLVVLHCLADLIFILLRLCVVSSVYVEGSGILGIDCINKWAGETSGDPVFIVRYHFSTHYMRRGVLANHLQSHQLICSTLATVNHDMSTPPRRLRTRQAGGDSQNGRNKCSRRSSFVRELSESATHDFDCSNNWYR